MPPGVRSHLQYQQRHIRARRTARAERPAAGRLPSVWVPCRSPSSIVEVAAWFIKCVAATLGREDSYLSLTAAQLLGGAGVLIGPGSHCPLLPSLLFNAVLTALFLLR
jgi:hypothetical protein